MAESGAGWTVGSFVPSKPFRGYLRGAGQVVDFMPSGARRPHGSPHDALSADVRAIGRDIRASIGKAGERVGKSR